MKSAASFITQLVSVSREVEPLVPIVNTHGETLFMQVMKCVGGEASRSYIDYFTDIVLALNKKYFDNLCRSILFFKDVLYLKNPITGT